MNKISDEVMRQIQEEITRQGGLPGSLEELNKIASRVMEKHNRTGISDFEGLSPHQMALLIDSPLESGCPVQFRQGFEAAGIENVPVLCAALHILAEAIKGEGIILTQKGNLPRKIVREIHDMNLLKLKDDGWPFGVLNEKDYWPVVLTRTLLTLGGWINVRKNKLVVSATAKKAISQERLFRSLFESYVLKFHKGYLDGYESEQIGNMGLLYVIYLLQKYGREQKEDGFYARMYFKAFPALIDEIQPRTYGSREEMALNCFTIRVFDRGLAMFGMISSEETGNDYRDRKTWIKAEELFYQVFEIDKVAGTSGK
jgi:hypothetical protein